MNDQELITAVRQSVHGVRMTVPAEQILSRSRAIRASGHRQVAACITAVAAAGSVVLGLGLYGALGAAPDGRTGTIRGTTPAPSTGTIRTVALTLTHSQVFHPAALQQALTQAGIPALVKTGTYCSSNPAPPSPSNLGVVTVQLRDGTPLPKPTAAYQTVPPANLVPADIVTVINPKAMPSGTELFFGYFNSDHGLFFDLIYTSSYTCSTGLPPAGPAGS